MAVVLVWHPIRFCTAGEYSQRSPFPADERLPTNAALRHRARPVFHPLPTSQRLPRKNHPLLRHPSLPP
jgi:hypothetical protein